MDRALVPVESAQLPAARELPEPRVPSTEPERTIWPSREMARDDTAAARPRILGVGFTPREASRFQILRNPSSPPETTFRPSGPKMRTYRPSRLEAAPWKGPRCHAIVPRGAPSWAFQRVMAPPRPAVMRNRPSGENKACQIGLPLLVLTSPGVVAAITGASPISTAGGESTRPRPAPGPFRSSQPPASRSASSFSLGCGRAPIVRRSQGASDG